MSSTIDKVEESAFCPCAPCMASALSDTAKRDIRGKALNRSHKLYFTL